MLSAVWGAGMVHSTRGYLVIYCAGSSRLSWVPIIVAALPNKSETWQKTWRGCCWVRAHLYLSCSQDTLISAKFLLFQRWNWTGAKTLGDAFPLHLWPHTLHQEPSLPGKNNRDHCAFSSQTPWWPSEESPRPWCCSLVKVRRKKMLPRAGIRYPTPSGGF